MKPWLLTLLTLISLTGHTLIIDVYSTKNPTQSLGQITFTDSDNGLKITPNLHHLSPGFHGMHIHQQASCQNEGMAALGHFDPKKTNKHLGPFKKGHLGDLPKLSVNAKGQAKDESTAPRLSIAMLKNHALIIHEGADNYQDSPKPLGGGGNRIACAIIKNVAHASTISN